MGLTITFIPRLAPILPLAVVTFVVTVAMRDRRLPALGG
jgi:hypothetical protein